MKPWPNMPWRICQNKDLPNIAWPCPTKKVVEELKWDPKLLETQKITLPESSTMTQHS